MSPSFEEHIDHLRTRLRCDLPGRDAQRRMSPLLDERLRSMQIEGRGCREGAVLALLFPMGRTAGLVLTKRPDTLTDHAGQISFPGGRREEEESLLEAALRETEEEVGVRAGDVRVLGPMTPLYIPPTNYCVHPFVGYLCYRPTFRPSPLEVERTIEVALERLLDPSIRKQETWTLRGREVEVPFFEIQEEIVWGATAMMLAEFTELLTRPA